MKPKLALVDFKDSGKRKLSASDLGRSVLTWDVMDSGTYANDSIDAANDFLNDRQDALVFVAHASFLLKQIELCKILSTCVRPVIVVSGAPNGAVAFVDRAFDGFWLTQGKYEDLSGYLWEAINNHSAGDPKDLRETLCNRGILLRPLRERRAWFAILLIAEKCLSEGQGKNVWPVEPFDWNAFDSHLTESSQRLELVTLRAYAERKKSTLRDGVIAVRNRAAQRIIVGDSL